MQKDGLEGLSKDELIKMYNSTLSIIDSLKSNFDIMKSMSNDIKEKITEFEKIEKGTIERVRHNGDYYYIAMKDYKFNVKLTQDTYGGCDDYLHKQSNYFHTQEQANKYRSHIEFLLELMQIRDILNDGWIPNWNNLDEDKYQIYLNHNDVSFSCGISACDTPLYFQTEEKRDLFLETVGEAKIKEFLLF